MIGCCKSRFQPGARALAFLLLGAALADCSSIGSSSSPTTTGSVSGRPQTFRERVTDLFVGPSASSADVREASVTARDPGDECPAVQIRPGTSTLQFAAPGTEPSAVNLRYQAVIARAARECAIAGGTMTIRVGVQGRVILGPQGGPGQLDVPLRYAVVQEGVDPKPIWTNLHKISVTIPPNQTNTSFVDIEESISFPLPSRDDLSAYVLYIGFDRLAAQEKPAARRRPAR